MKHLSQSFFKFEILKCDDTETINIFNYEEFTINLNLSVTVGVTTLDCWTMFYLSKLIFLPKARYHYRSQHNISLVQQRINHIYSEPAAEVSVRNWTWKKRRTLRRRSQGTNLSAKNSHYIGKITFFRENILSLLFFLWGTMLHSTLHMTAVVKHSISFYQPFFSDANSWGWSLLLLTVSHTRIWWLRLGFGELALQRMLPWPFLFIWPAVFVSILLLAKWVALKWIWAGHCSRPDVPSADFSLR